MLKNYKFSIFFAQLLLCLIIVMPVSSCCFTNIQAQETKENLLENDVLWQQSTAINVQLGIREKFGNLKQYEASFIVTDAKGKEFKLTKKIKSDEWQFVYFPEDFNTDGGKGIYRWKGTVNDKTVIHGKFEYLHLNSVNIIEEW